MLQLEDKFDAASLLHKKMFRNFEITGSVEKKKDVAVNKKLFKRGHSNITSRKGSGRVF